MTDAIAVPRKESWREALLNRRMVICAFTGFSSGLPLYLLINLLPAWLRSEGVDLKAIGLFALIGLPYTWKFLWSPLLDRYALPLGRRRGWMATFHIALLLSIPALGFLSPKADIWAIAYLAAAVAFFSASLDIVLDAFRRELLPDAELGLGNSIYVNTYRIASLIPGSLALILSDHLPWSAVFTITALFMLPGLLMTLVVREPDVAAPPPRSLRDAVIEPFREFLQRAGWKNAVLILAFIFFYKIGDSMATALATKFYLDLGFSMTQIGLAANTTGFWASLAGGVVGGVWMLKLGINRGLWVFGALQAIAILGFAWLAQVGPNTMLLSAVIGFEAFASLGLGAAAFVAFLSRTTDPRYTATQYALFSSLSAVPRTLINASVGFLVAELGWFSFFIVCFFLAFPAMMMLPKIAPWRSANGTNIP